MKKDISIVHTLAQDYYPLNSDIEKLIGSSKLDDATRFADLMRGLDTGDAGEYQHMKMLTGECYDPVRPTALLGFVSPKNQRIFSILDKKEYDIAKWSELENVRYFYDFFKKHEKEFEQTGF